LRRRRRLGPGDPGGEDQGEEEEAGVREQVRAGEELAAPPGDPEGNVEERLVDQIGQQRADEERAPRGGGEGAVRAERELLADAEVAEREHGARILNGLLRSVQAFTRNRTESMVQTRCRPLSLPLSPLARGEGKPLR
jgi:hypothetical protein